VLVRSRWSVRAVLLPALEHKLGVGDMRDAHQMAEKVSKSAAEISHLVARL